MNNVDVDKLRKFVEDVKKDPAQALKKKSVEGSWVFEEGKPQFVAKLEYPNGGVTLSCELPPFAGGWGTSPDPIQYCLYGLAACFAATLMATATGEGIELRKLEVRAENEIDLHKNLGLSKDPIIKKVRLVVRADGPSEAEMQRLIKLAEERCPGVECVTSSIPFETSLEK
ncbi:MAG TPA: OsmC family peroxiredoxin [Aigarchaeota archaeon]|nr:OsmC family peroxiredoxin [Aigarchaeota archaeon]